MYGWAYICITCLMPKEARRRTGVTYCFEEILTSTLGFYKLKKNMYIGVSPESISVHYMCTVCFQRPEKGIKSPGTRLTGCCELPLVLKPSSLESCQARSLWTISPAPIARLLSTKWNCFSGKISTEGVLLGCASLRELREICNKNWSVLLKKYLIILLFSPFPTSFCP